MAARGFAILGMAGQLARAILCQREPWERKVRSHEICCSVNDLHKHWTAGCVLFYQRQRATYAENTPGGRWNWVEKELQDFISRVLTVGTKRCPVLIFVDALDECGTDAARSLLAYFKDLMKNVEREGEQLEEKIFAKAQGGFQWAVLVCNKVIKEKAHGTKETERHQMLKLFRWVLFAERPLSAQELRDALSIDEDTDCKARLRNHESWSDTLADFELHVKHLSRVANFLLNDFLHRRDQKVSHTPVGDGHYQLSRSRLKYMTLDEVLEGAGLPRYRLWPIFPLVPYAIQFLFHHIRKVEQERIPQHDLLSIHTPLGRPFIGATALHAIVAFGSKSAFDDFLRRDAVQLDGTDTDGNTPLILAIREGHQSVALALLERTNEAEIQNLETSEQGRACREGEEHQKYQLINVNAENKDGDTPLTIAVTENAGEVVLKSIEAGANLNYLGQSAALVSCAIRSRDEILLKKLLELNFNLDGAVYCALLELENSGSALKVFLSELLKAGANASRSPEFYRRVGREGEDEYESDGGIHDDHAISIASRRGQAAVANILLTHGISATTQNQYEETPLLIALTENHEDTARLLLEMEPSAVELEDEDGRTALSVALEMEHLEMAICFIKKGKFSATSAGLRDALYRSINGDMLEVVKAILEKDRSTLEGKYSDNKTPLHLAA
ncbi:cortactin-binding protein, putative [Talaromyces stipitatus ATCC 10500]|uniref:Cortactin-binding protein, putative n=1 Tax=Talaromyces stipitatus (strain ATCC 10500 / CBS 375.48 / QM 6759 / NRRL 1006) TaxID=441959 RepID=B8M3J3_TALSN|nr:cortactin-binding protein, putative [Talaromyces stipitatus ATCC 10500]EED22365.1 cortactin-binding protein, putative [Talaromyces stipitatus ATCC 10500]